jgi:hypothetical protein
MRHSIPAAHAQHDLELIAGHAAGDLSDTDRPRADTLLQSCTSCADLRSDLVAIAATTRTLSTTAPAPRDFRLDAAQAARLRRGGWIASLLRPFAAPRSPARPMAMALTSLGLAGLLVANILPSLFGSAASLAPQRDQAAGAPAGTAAAAAAPTAAPAANPDAGQPGASLSAEFGVAGHPTPGPTFTRTKAGDLLTLPPVAAGGAQASAETDSSDARLNALESAENPTTNVLLLGSLAFLVAGIVLFGLRIAARRLR